MKNTFFFSLIALSTLLSCNTSTDKKAKDSGQKVNISLFLKQFQEITFDTLHLYSPSDTLNGNKFVGAKIDTMFYSLFSYDAILKSNLDNGAEIFACFKFKLSKNHTGLILRTRSQYSETAVNLWIWNNQEKQITKGLELADAFGDGEWHFQKDGWLTDLNNDKQFDIVNRKIDCWMDDVDSGVGQAHTTDSVFVFFANGTSYDNVKIQVDTSKFKMFKMGTIRRY